MRLFYIFIVFVLIFSPLVNAAVGDPPPDCSQCIADKNECLINLSVKTQEFNNLSLERDYYKNLSEYYITILKEQNLTMACGDIMQISETLNVFNTNLTTINQRLGDVENKISLFSFEVGISVVSATAISVALIEIVLKCWKRRKK